MKLFLARITLAIFILLPTEYAKCRSYLLFQDIGNDEIAPRDIYVYLPPMFSPRNKYPVVYMHDGQNLFDPDRAFMGQTWHVDGTLDRLIKNKEIVPLIVVAIDNSKNRLEEYTPNNEADEYIRFIIETIKPKIDDLLPTLKDRASTGIIGSSLGGLVSLHAALKFPVYFGKVAALSPSIWWNDMEILDVIKTTSILPLKVYMDSGTAGGERPDHVLLAKDNFLSRGMTLNKNLMYFIDENAEHSEKYWTKHFPIAMKFLFSYSE